MLTMLGSPRRCCDGITRRETLKAGALTALGGFGLPHFLRAEEAGQIVPGKAKSVILLYLLGGAASQDMWDLKPDAPQEIRGEFKPIDTNVVGIQIGEHLPMTATWMHKMAIVRSLNHKAGCHNCLPSYCGWELPPTNQHPTDNDAPSMGSVCEYLKGHFPGWGGKLGDARPLTPTLPHEVGGRIDGAGGRAGDDFPAYVYMPNWLGWGQAFRRAGPYGGFLGKQFDPLTTECEPFWDNVGHQPLPGTPQTVRGEPVLPNSVLQDGITIDRMNQRRTLLGQLDDEVRRAEREGTAANFDRAQQKAFDLLTSSRLRSCFDLKSEDPKVLERYGRTLFGNTTLIARRLVENGVKFVNVTWDLYWDRIKIDYDAWDTHQRNFSILKTNKLPGLDQTFTALMEDLEQSGLLDETLVVIMSEMGRTPRINANAGRDHWTFCYSAVFAGAGVRGGTVYGASDSQAAYVKSNPASTADICATIYSILGISPEFRVPDRTNRPVEIAHGGQAIREIIA
jgi:hypothetical protein